MEILPRFGSRVRELVQGVHDDQATVYVRVRSGPVRSRARTIGRIDLAPGQVVEVPELVDRMDNIIHDAAAYDGALLELVQYDPRGRVAEPVHTIWVPPNLEDRMQAHEEALERGEHVKVLTQAVVRMTEASELRAQQMLEMTLQLLHNQADLRVEAAHLQNALVHQNPEDPRLEAARIFAETVGPMVPAMLEKMQNAGRVPQPAAQLPAGEPTTTADAEVSDGDYQEIMDSLLDNLEAMTEARPDLWTDHQRQAKAAGIFAAAKKGMTTEDAGDPPVDSD